MISKRELITRLCIVEADLDFAMEEIDKLEKRVKKLEPKKERKVKSAKKVSK